METASPQGHFTLKKILRENWIGFLALYEKQIGWHMAYNVWKVINCREPDGLGFFTMACPDHSDQIQHVPISCKSRFCSVCGKVQSDKWVSKMNLMFPNCPYYHITFTVPSQFRKLLFEKRALLNAVFAACKETLLSFCAEQGFLPAITAVLHTFGSALNRHIHIHIIISARSRSSALQNLPQGHGLCRSTPTQFPQIGTGRVQSCLFLTPQPYLGF